MKKLLLILSLILLVGAGCGKEEKREMVNCLVVYPDTTKRYELEREACLRMQISELQVQYIALSQKITIQLKKPIKRATCSHRNGCRPIEDLESSEIPIREFLELLAKEYQYVPETTEVKKAKLIKVK